MKNILFGLLFLSNFCFSQQFYAGITDYQTRLFREPVPNPYYAPIEESKTTITKGENVYVFGRIDTVVNNEKYHFVAAIYKNMDGFISMGHVELTQADIREIPYISMGKYDSLKEITKLHVAFTIRQDSIALEEKYKEQRKQNKIEADLEAKIRKRDSINYIKNHAAAVRAEFGIYSLDFSTDDYGVDADVSIENLSHKTIKYVWINIKLYNPVHDLIGTRKVTIVGPIYYNHIGSATFEKIKYTKIFSYGKIGGIKVQYMDGSIKNLNQEQAASVSYY